MEEQDVAIGARWHAVVNVFIRDHDGLWFHDNVNSWLFMKMPQSWGPPINSIELRLGKCDNLPKDRWIIVGLTRELKYKWIEANYPTIAEHFRRIKNWQKNYVLLKRRIVK